MNQLASNFNQFLPINRKERFYTATILPGIICSDNFRDFNLFLKLIRNFPSEVQINADASDNNIQFITEFSLKESVDYCGRDFCDIPATKDTPDLVILITKPELLLVVIEGKMFGNTPLADFKTQIEAQKIVINSLHKTLKIKPENIFHIGLVPKSYFPSKPLVNCQMMYWEDIIDAYNGVQNNQYFLEVLKLAVNNYTSLTSSKEGAFGSFGKNMEDKLNGVQILAELKKGKNFWVGRNRGLAGDFLRKDRDSGGWKSFNYEVNFKSETAPNRNWFSAKDFAAFVHSEAENQQTSFSEVIDPWHFSHLGKDYFIKISEILGFGGRLDCPVNIVYTGKSNVEYIEKQRGRQVNPNWSVVLKDGKNLRYGSASGNRIQEGLWGSANCKKTRWSDILNYNWD